MKLSVSAVLLSFAVILPAHAQTASDAPAPPQPGMQFGGSHDPRGSHGVGPGMAAHHVETVAGIPFTAQFSETGSFTSRDGKQEQHTSTNVVYRDSQGRVRIEATFPPRPPRPPVPSASGDTPSAPPEPRAPRTVVTVFDPVAHTITHLNAERQTAYIQAVPAKFFARMQQREEAGASGQHRRNNASSTSLGSKTIAGVSASGEQTVLTFPARDGGAAHTITRQSWFAPDEKFEVSSSETGDRGTHTDVLTSFTKGEPDPGLFQVPAGYTTSNEPERHGGPHQHGGPERLGAPDEDAPPPPPAP